MLLLLFKSTTVSKGSFGSRIDEERSELRNVARHAMVSVECLNAVCTDMVCLFGCVLIIRFSYLRCGCMFGLF